MWFFPDVFGIKIWEVWWEKGPQFAKFSFSFIFDYFEYGKKYMLILKFWSKEFKTLECVSCEKSAVKNHVLRIKNYTCQKHFHCWYISITEVLFDSYHSVLSKSTLQLNFNLLSLS